MDDYKIIIYIVLGVIYYGYKFLSKKKEETPVVQQPQKRKAQNSQKPAAQTKRPTSIQDLLDEVKREQQRNEQRPVYESLENKTYETVDYDTNPEKAVVRNVNPYQEYRTLDVNTVEDDSTRFAEFVPGVKKQHPILDTLKNKNKVKEAFIVSEIFNRKHD